MSKLAEIMARKPEEVRLSQSLVPLSFLEDQAAGQSPRGFRAALAGSPRPVSLIAEVKRGSPSQGIIRENFDPVELAQAYVRGGATCLSILTDGPGFGGSPEHLQVVRAACDLPILRKDFMIDPYQLWEAKAWGADCILLIVAGLEVAVLTDLYQQAKAMGLDVLVETHNAQEFEVALTLGADMIGVNNRSLITFEEDLSVAESLLPQIPEGCLGVGESAISKPEHVDRMQAAGARAVLIGTALAKSSDPEAKVREVMGW